VRKAKADKEEGGIRKEEGWEEEAEAASAAAAAEQRHPSLTRARNKNLERFSA
jgi:hypothetical protein